MQSNSESNCEVMMKRWGWVSVLGLVLAHSAAADDWQYNLALDASYAARLEGDAPQRWRSKVTSTRLNQLSPTVASLIVRKQTSDVSRWGMELGLQAGADTDGQKPTDAPIAGVDTLRYLSRANVSYRADVGNGLLFTAGLMNSFYGFESFLAKDNPTTSRSWMADYSPYFLIGAGAQYPLTPQLTLGFYLLNDYDYLAYRNDAPKYGWQAIWSINPRWQWSQNLFAGPEQLHSAATPAWRFYSNSVLQYRQAPWLVAWALDIGTQPSPDVSDKQRLWLGSGLWLQRQLTEAWRVALRPEVYWDRDGHMTGSAQLIQALTATLEYKIPLPQGQLALRTEYRYDQSTGPQGGFFAPNPDRPGFVPEQQLLLFSCLYSFDSP